MLIQQHIHRIGRSRAAGAGIVAGQRQRTGHKVHGHEHGQQSGHPGADPALDRLHPLCHQRVAIADPGHGRNAPEEAVQQVDAPAQIELEAAVIPEHGAEQQLCHSAAHILIRTAQDHTEPEDAALALLFAAPQQDGGQHQRQPPHHAERAPHQAGTAHPDPGGDAAEDGLHHISEESPDDKEPEQVGKGELLFGTGGGLRTGRSRVCPLDPLFHAGGNFLPQPLRAPAQLPIQLLKPWVAVCIPADHHHGRDLVKDGQRHADPYHSVEQQRRQVAAEPEQQVVAPADCRHAQQTPQQGVLQADIAVQIELFIGVVPPAAVVDPFQQFGGQPLHHRGIDHAAEEQCRQAGALVVQADGDEHPCRAVHKAEGAGSHAAVGEPAALCGCNNGLAYPA